MCSGFGSEEGRRRLLLILRIGVSLYLRILLRMRGRERNTRGCDWSTDIWDDLVENKKSQGVNPPSSDPQRNDEPKIPRNSRQLLRCHLDLQPWSHNRHTIRSEKCGWVEGASIYRWRGVFKCLVLGRTTCFWGGRWSTVWHWEEGLSKMVKILEDELRRRWCWWVVTVLGR